MPLVCAPGFTLKNKLDEDVGVRAVCVSHRGTERQPTNKAEEKVNGADPNAIQDGFGRCGGCGLGSTPIGKAMTFPDDAPKALTQAQMAAKAKANLIAEKAGGDPEVARLLAACWLNPAKTDLLCHQATVNAVNARRGSVEGKKLVVDAALRAGGTSKTFRPVASEIEPPRIRRSRELATEAAAKKARAEAKARALAEQFNAEAARERAQKARMDKSATFMVLALIVVGVILAVRS
jgi:hypothetical protein